MTSPNARERNTQHVADNSGTRELRTEPHWSAAVGFLVGWLLPAKTARRTAHLPLRQAFLFHVLVGLTAVFVTTVLPTLLRLGDAIAYSGLIGQWMRFVGEVAKELARRPADALAAAAGLAACIEAAFLVLALLFMPWGARGEPMKQSLAHCLRQVWMHTTHLLVIALLAAGLALTLDQCHYRWSYLNPQPEWPARPRPAVAPGTPGYVEAQQAAQDSYLEELRTHLQTLLRWRNSRPWYVKYQEAIFVNSVFVLAIWLFWSVLRGVGASGRADPIKRPPKCESCGYNLTGLTMEGRCPECGDPVADSLGPNARPGAIWQNRREVGRWHAWRRCSSDAMSRPAWFGRRLRVSNSGVDHRSFLYVHLPIFFAIGSAGMLSAIAAGGAWGQLARMPGNIATMAAACGSFAMVGGVLLTLLAALLVGSYYGSQEKRNLLGASMQVSVYQVGFVVAWMLFAAFTVPVVIVSARLDWFEPFSGLTGIDGDSIAFLLWLLPNIALMIKYFTLVARGTAAMRYANS